MRVRIKHPYSLNEIRVLTKCVEAEALEKGEFQEGADDEEPLIEEIHEESEPAEKAIEVVTMYENPFEDQMEEKRLYLLDYYELMKHCVESTLGMDPHITSPEAMTECTGSHFKIMVHEFDEAMKRVTDWYEEILRHKFSLMGPEYKREIEEFIFNLKDFVKRDFQVKDSLALSIRGAKLIVDEQLYQELITASESILQDLESYRLELKKGRDNIIMGIRVLLEERDKQIEEMLKEEERAAKAALEEEKRRQEEEERRKQMEANLAKDMDGSGRSGEFDESSENSEDSDSHESEETADDSGHSSEGEESQEEGDNFVDLDHDSEHTHDSNVDYDAMSSDEKIFDEFRDVDDERKAINDIHENQIEEEWQRLKTEHKLDPRLAYVDGDEHLQEKDHSMKSLN